MKIIRTCLILVVTLLYCTTASAKKVKIDGIWYNLIPKAKQAEVTSGSSKYQGNIIIPSTVTYEDVVYDVKNIGESAFELCTGLRTITIPESVISIGDHAFYHCYLLKSFTISENSKLTSIGEYAFSECGLTSITIPQSVTSIGKYAFEDCFCVESVHINSMESWCNIDFGNVESNPIYSSMTNLYLKNQLVTELIIPNSVTEINALTFWGCSSISSITITDNSLLTSIGNSAFAHCFNLTSINISSNSKLTSIGQNVFVNCKSLTSVDIPESITSIGYNAFGGCVNLSSVYISSIESWCKISYGNESATPLCYARNLYLDKKPVTELVIPNTLSEIKDYAFRDCNSLTAISIPESITSIGGNAFSGCSNLSSVYISSMESWCNIDFENAYSNPLGHAKNLYLKGQLVTELIIPDTITTIKDYAFYGCPVGSVFFPEGLTSVGEKAFASCSSIESIVLPKGVTSVGDMAFSYCRSLKSITIPQNVKSIKNGLCYECSSLNTIILKSIELSSIGSSAFAKCPELLDVYCYAKKVPTTETNAFNGSYPQYANLHVPAGSLESYKTKTPWNGFGQFESLVIPVSEINLKLSSTTITEGDSLMLVATILPEDATNKSISWRSSCPDVAAVDKNGKITAIIPGTTIITATAEDGSEVSTSCELLVIPANYVITYLIDEEIFAIDTLQRGTFINVIVPVKEGYTFSGWGEVPERMPNHDITLSGTFVPNKYLVTFKIGDEVIASDSLEYGATIVTPEAPEREGYTFNGWGEVSDTVPAGDVTYEGSYSINKYLVTFKIGHEVIASDSLEYGATIVTPEAPEREGYTFDGWGEVAETVPAGDVTYEGSYSVNSYILTYEVDGITIKTDTIDYGTAIEVMEEPVKEGYTFSGWSEIPASMPAYDVTVSGVFAINKYLVTFKIGDEVIASDSLEYGASIVAPDAPEREGYTFDGWGEVAKTVPAGDVTYEGSYTANTYKVYYYVGEELVHTVEVTYGEAIPEYVYEPTEEGYTFLGWIGDTYETMPAHDVTYTANIDNAINELTIDNGQLTIYDLTGHKVQNTDNLKGGIYIVNGKKVVIK